MRNKLFNAICLIGSLWLAAATLARAEPICRLVPFPVGVCRLGADHVLGANHSADERISFAIYSFLVEGPDGERALVDLGPQTTDYLNQMFRRYGFFRDLGPHLPPERRFPDDIVQPEGNVFEHLKRLEISPGQIRHVIFTHLHADHHGMDDAKGGGAAESFPNSLLHVSAVGLNDNLSKRKNGRWNSYVDYAFGDFLIKRQKEGKLRLEDDATIFPGLRTMYLGGHSVCSQAVLVNTADGLVILASDEVYLYRLLADGVLPRIHTSEVNYRSAIERIVQLAAKEKAIIIPMHDPLVGETYRTAGNEWLRRLRVVSDEAVKKHRMAKLASPSLEAHEIPITVDSLWADYDPRQEPLDAKVVREWEEGGIVFRYVTYHIGTFKGVPARMAAFYAFPKGGERLPGLLHLHGGGQRAFLGEVSYYAKRGYACLSINWGGREMENAKPGEPNTEWGAVDPTQNNVPGYFSLKPGPKQLDPVESPRNNNWYLLTIGARRGLTFLEKQTEVDPDRLGVYGLSMGGSLTVYVAGTDNRIKAAVPQVGGSGFSTYPWPLLPEQTKMTPQGDLSVYRATMEFESYAPHIEAPLLYLGATNDFNGIMDHTYRTGALIPHGNVRYAFAPHLNHRFTPEFQITSSLWLDQHLKGTFQFPATPESKLVLDTGDHVPLLRVVPDASKPVEQVSIYYSLDPEPRARFWRSAEVQQEGKDWSAKLPLMSLEQPLFAFANLSYHLDQPELPISSAPTQTFAISSLLQKATADELKSAGAVATDHPSMVIEGFSHGYGDWYLHSADNPQHWQYWTRKINDPKWRGKQDYRLCFEVRSEHPNKLIVVLTENDFRPYRGKQQEFLAVVDLKGGDWQTVTLVTNDFKTIAGQPLKSWENVDDLGLRAYYDEGGKVRLGSDRWSGSQPSFRDLRWEEVHGE